LRGTFNNVMIIISPSDWAKSECDNV
jgi:hypothetical protein